MSKGKILVTGGTGYIGSHTCVELINSGYEPIIVDDFSNSERFVVERIQKITDNSIKLIEGNCANENWLLNKLRNVDIIGFIHFAAFKAVGESSAEPLKYYENNINSTLAVLKVMKQLEIRNLVFSSSCTVYGQPDKLPVTEESPIKPAESPYGRTKQMCEDIISDFKTAGNDIKALSLRYFNPIGAHPSGLIGELPLGVPNNLVPFITQTAAGLRDQLTIFGNDYDTPDGTCIRDYIHVVDLAKAHVAAIDYLIDSNNPLYDFINIGTGEGHSVKEVIETFEKVNGVDLNYSIGERRPGDVVKVFADVSKANSLLNWKANLALSDGLKDSWNWQKSLNN